MQYISNKYASFVSKLKYEDLPRRVRNRAKQLIFDTLGCAIVGSRTPASRIIVDYVLEQGCKAESTVICAHKKTVSEYAMLANSVMSHADDFDDVHHCSALHPAGVLVPAAIATAEKLNKKGEDVITSFVAGYEVMERLGEALVPAHQYDRGFHPTCTTGSFGAACTIAKLCELDEKQLVQTIGIAGSFSSGLMEFLQNGSMTKRLHPGIAAYGGSVAVQLAHRGFTGPASIIEGKSGFLNAFTYDPHIEKLDEGLGEKYDLLTTQIKLFSCNGAFQTSIESLLTIMDENNIQPEEIGEILVKIASPVSTSFNPYNPRTPLDAQMSLPYSLAVAAFEKKAGINQYTKERIKDPRILGLMNKIKMTIDNGLAAERKEDCTKLGSEVMVKTESGKTYAHCLQYPKDGPGNWRADEVEVKFINNSSQVLGGEIAEKLLKLIKNLEEVDDISKLTMLLRKD